MPRLSLNTKLLLVWASTILGSLVLLALVSLVILSAFHETNIKAKSQAALENSIDQLAARRAETKNHVNALAMRSDIIDTVNLLNSYQDKSNYDAGVFGPLKNELAAEVLQLELKFEQIRIMDASGDPAVVHNTTPSGGVQLGISTYLNGMLQMATSPASPLPYDAAPNVQHRSSTAGRLVSTSTVISERDGDIFATSIAPIKRARVNGEEQIVGYVMIRDDLSTYASGELSSLNEARIDLMPIEGMRGLLRQQREETGDTIDPSHLENLPEDGLWLETPASYIGIYTLPEASRVRQYLSITLDKIALDLELEAIWQAILVVTGIIFIVLTTLGSMWLRHSILDPLNNLMARIEHVSSGNYDETSPIKSKDEFGQLARSFEDMAQRVRDRESRLADILRLAPEGIVTADQDLNISLFNAGAENIFGYSMKEVLGKPVSILLPSRFRQRHDKHMLDFANSSTIQKKMNSRSQVFGLRKNGEEFPAAASISKINLGAETVHTVLIRDITQQLEDQSDLIGAKQKAEEANEAKSRFIAAMSHELRTPLNAIIGMSTMINAGYFGELNEKYREYATDILKSGEYLLVLIDEILDMSALESGEAKLKVESLSLRGALDHCLRLVREEALAKQIRLDDHSISDAETITADERALHKIILNVVNNAIKFSPEGSSIQISSLSDKNYVTIVIEDQGIGIPQERVDELMKPFLRHQDDSYLSGEGWGLGLAITKSLMDLHHGQITINSVVGEGTSVQLHFPKTDTTKHPTSD